MVDVPAVFWPPCSSIPIVSPNLFLIVAGFQSVQIHSPADATVYALPEASIAALPL
jgi:hypothetical protein